MPMMSTESVVPVRSISLTWSRDPLRGLGTYSPSIVMDRVCLRQRPARGPSSTGTS